jgi:hypothetical protein
MVLGPCPSSRTAFSRYPQNECPKFCEKSMSANKRSRNAVLDVRSGVLTANTEFTLRGNGILLHNLAEVFGFSWPSEWQPMISVV